MNSVEWNSDTELQVREVLHKTDSTNQKLAAATPSGWLYEPETPSESSLTMEWRRYNPGHNMARQLRPYFPWSVPARKLAWLRSWRLCGWWRVLFLKGEPPDP